MGGVEPSRELSRSSLAGTVGKGQVLRVCECPCACDGSCERELEAWAAPGRPPPALLPAPHPQITQGGQHLHTVSAASWSALMSLSLSFTKE